MLLCLLIVVCIIASSSTFSAMPKGKFPIEILSSRNEPTPTERQVITELEKAFSNSSKFRVTSSNEDRIMLLVLMQDYRPGVASTDVFATASPVRIYTLVWLAKPVDNHACFLWHELGRYGTYNDIIQQALKSADAMVRIIKNEYSYLFELKTIFQQTSK